MNRKQEASMVLKEIVQTCSHPKVAEAAVASIGGALARDLNAEESRNHLPPGKLTSLIVEDFSANASFDQMAEVDAAASGTDQPILTGLRRILVQSGVSNVAPVAETAPRNAGGASILADPGVAEKTAKTFEGGAARS